MKKLSKCNDNENFYKNLHLLSHLNRKLGYNCRIYLSIITQK